MIAGPAELPGQTEHTVGLCNYRYGSQLDDAVAFLEQHSGQVAFVTISIGANDVIPCGTDFPCLMSALQTIQTNLATILGGSAQRPDRRTDRGNELLLDGDRCVVRESRGGAGDREPHRAGE